LFFYLHGTFIYFERLRFKFAKYSDISFLLPNTNGSFETIIPICYAIGILSTYKFQSTTFLKFEFHEKVPFPGGGRGQAQNILTVEVNKKGGCYRKGINNYPEPLSFIF
jgi:hypothetical protein